LNIRASRAGNRKKDHEYVSMSPHAKYDATRNMRNLDDKLEEELMEDTDFNMR